jgi:hypothetical protein
MLGQWGGRWLWTIQWVYGCPPRYLGNLKKYSALVLLSHLEVVLMHNALHRGYEPRVISEVESIRKNYNNKAWYDVPHKSKTKDITQRAMTSQPRYLHIR